MGLFDVISGVVGDIGTGNNIKKAATVVAAGGMAPVVVAQAIMAPTKKETTVTPHSAEAKAVELQYNLNQARGNAPIIGGTQTVNIPNVNTNTGKVTTQSYTVTPNYQYSNGGATVTNTPTIKKEASSDGWYPGKLIGDVLGGSTKKESNSDNGGNGGLFNIDLGNLPLGGNNTVYLPGSNDTVYLPFGSTGDLPASNPVIVMPGGVGEQTTTEGGSLLPILLIGGVVLGGAFLLTRKGGKK